ncbi:chemotaxis protein CheW [Pseudohongiella sp. SYSU M77423]|uniref:chemotaxis protein CheW n=1 Tax=Pseudohongiella sp. SYSU M77423 TaxID=3042312 RepID=UPI00247FAB70|nr:chemotaxis protein CheW [Pseudohongiella sp. SYSU M77423]MDH7942996.1 chemotaxis protein CheW [Pseudohongiella sp. SYSU M77423]
MREIRTAAKVDVVQDYLDALLRDVTQDFMPSVRAVPAQSRRIPTFADPDIALADEEVVVPPVVEQEFVAEPALEEPVEEPVLQATSAAAVAAEEKTEQRVAGKVAEKESDQEPIAAKKADVDAETQLNTLDIAQAAQQVRGLRQAPEWANKPFASLLFSVLEMDMAAPLHDLGGICPIEDGKIQPVAGQASWFMGLLRWNGKNIRVIDTADLLMPERCPADRKHRQDYQSVIVLGDSLWGLAVSHAEESVRLEPSQLRWREGGSSRPWLAGTLLDRLCSLLDVEVLSSMLAAADRGLDKNKS